MIVIVNRGTRGALLFPVGVDLFGRGKRRDVFSRKGGGIIKTYSLVWCADTSTTNEERAGRCDEFFAMLPRINKIFGRAGRGFASLRDLECPSFNPFDNGIFTSSSVFYQVSSSLRQRETWVVKEETEFGRA